MTKPLRASRLTPLDDDEFVVSAPVRDEASTADSDGTIEVTLDNNGDDNYQITIYLTPFDPGGTNWIDGETTDMNTGTGYSIRMPIDLTLNGGDPNRVIQVDNLDTYDGTRFEFSVEAGSGSGSGSGSGCGSGSGSDDRHKPVHGTFYRPGQMVPVGLTLKLDSKLTKGTCAKCAELNRPTLLLHSADPKFVKCWFSQPIAFCGKGAPPGYWVLEKNSATAWTLVLQQGDQVLVTFTAKTKPKDCSLPITLQRKGAGTKVCKDWPKSVTISPAS